VSELNLILLGPPGSGKGTQGERLRDDLELPYYATGDILRAAVREQTELGRKAKEYMDRGDLVPDEVIIGVIAERIDGHEAEDGFILDGFPRTVAQAEALDHRLAQLDTPLDAALNFDVTEEELFRRLAGRSAALHRSDDTEQTIRHRLEVFAHKTRPLIDYYRQRGLLVGVDAVGAIPRVHARIDAALAVVGVTIGSLASSF
jgi:adenylate kinase